MSESKVVGLNLGHDGGSCLSDGDLIRVALSEERVTRKKYVRGFASSLAKCLETAKFQLADADAIVFVNDGRPLPRDFTGSLELLGAPKSKCYTARHHLIHASCAFFTTRFDNAAIIVVDGEGNTGECESYFTGSHNTIRKIGGNDATQECLGIGRVYEAFTNLLGWGYQEAGKTMALAGSGNPERFGRRPLFFVDALRVKSSLSYDSMDSARWPDSLAAYQQDLFRYKHAICAAEHILRIEPDCAFDELTTHGELAADIAAYVQQQLEEVMVNLVRRVVKATGLKQVCLAGGVALNVVVNRSILEHAGVDELHIPPAANDRGLPLGAALYGRHVVLDQPERVQFTTDFLGPVYDHNSIEEAISEVRRKLRGLFNSVAIERPANLAETVAGILARGGLVGRFDGRSECGPRALGNRSILADPRSRNIVDRLNSQVKHRESFRPYAAAVLVEEVSTCFDIDRESPFMMFTARVIDSWKDRVPGIVHVDETCRIQTVDRVRTETLHDIVLQFKDLTGIPMILNTSFNKAGEPMVETPQEAIECFLTTGLDALAVGRFVLTKRCKSDDVGEGM